MIESCINVKYEMFSSFPVILKNFSLQIKLLSSFEKNAMCFDFTEKTTFLQKGGAPEVPNSCF